MQASSVRQLVCHTCGKRRGPWHSRRGVYRRGGCSGGEDVLGDGLRGPQVRDVAAMEHECRLNKIIELAARPLRSSLHTRGHRDSG